MTEKEKHIMGMAQCEAAYSKDGLAVQFTVSVENELSRGELNELAAIIILSGLVKGGVNLDNVIASIKAQGMTWGVA